MLNYKELICLCGRLNKKIINRYDLAELNCVDERTIRRAISEARKELLVVYIQANYYKSDGYVFTKGDYVLYDPNDLETQKALDMTVNDDYKAFLSLYFNNVLPLKKLVRDQNLITKLGQVVFPLGESNEINK